MINGECLRFCSNERLIVPFTKLVEDPKTKRLVLGATGNKAVMIGTYCNNIGNWVDKLSYCPARWALTNRGGYEGKEYQLAEKYVNPVGSA
jgi:hypothetical protein